MARKVPWPTLLRTPAPKKFGPDEVNPDTCEEEKENAIEVFSDSDSSSGIPANTPPTPNTDATQPRKFAQPKHKSNAKSHTKQSSAKPRAMQCEKKKMEICPICHNYYVHSVCDPTHEGCSGVPCVDMAICPRRGTLSQKLRTYNHLEILPLTSVDYDQVQTQKANERKQTQQAVANAIHQSATAPMTNALRNAAIAQGAAAINPNSVRSL